MGKIFTKKRHLTQANTRIGKDTTCPICGKFFTKKSTYEEVNDHIDECSKETNKNINEEFKEFTIPISHSFREIKKEKKKIKDETNSNNIEKNLSFENKLDIFKKQMKSLKTDWREGCCTISLTRENVLKQSMEQFIFIDPFKELKINFLGEISSDAGGLIREWYTVIFQELQNENQKLFQRSDTDEFSFIIHNNILPNVENLEIFNFIGKIIGKALLENLTINTCLNKLFYKIILSEEVTINDLELYDKSLYLSLKELKKMKDISILEMYFVVNYELDGKIYTDDLISNGSNILLTNDNLEKYIERRIQYILNQMTPYILELKTGLFSIISQSYLSIFNSSEFELILNGISVININDWKENTEYQGSYNSNHKVIKWFWKTLEKMSQEERAKFLQFSTGTTRLPIGGFKHLESNRGQLSKFCIVSVELNKAKQNFIRAHTCFNRIDLPKFSSEAEVSIAINFVIKNDVYGFGID